MTKEVRIYNGEKNSLFNKWCWENWTATCRKMKLAHIFTAYTKISPKWIKDQNVRLDTIKLLEENIGRTLSEINHSIFFGPSPRIMEIKTKINKWNLIKFKSFCTIKETVSESVRLSRVRLFVTPWTIQSMEFSRLEYWSG